MLVTNLRDGKHYGYFDIQKDGDQWVAFYYKQIEPTEILNGKTDIDR